MTSSLQATPEAAPDGRVVLRRLRELPGGPELLDLGEARGGAELVGGAVRDLLLDPAAMPRELDTIVSHDPLGFAGALAEAISKAHAEVPKPRVHERFGTATVQWPGGRIDVAQRRSERYAHPGALPETRPGSAEQDLARRDFTVNAIAVALGGSERGTLRCAEGALEDLAARRLRVLHPGSFIDDPTRILRLARYRARLRFEPDEPTARLAAEAIALGALQTVSHARIGAELGLALAEPDPVAALASLERLGALSALHEAIRFDEPLARAALGELPEEEGAWPAVLLLASLLLPGPHYDATDYESRLRALLDGWELPAAERERVVHGATLAPRLLGRLHAASAPSQIYDAAHAAPLEAVALAAALAEKQGPSSAAAAARRWLAELRKVQLEIDGEDLLAAGVPRGPEVGRRLRRALERKLDGKAEGREAELRAALEDA